MEIATRTALERKASRQSIRRTRKMARRCTRVQPERSSTSSSPHCCWQATALQLHFLIAASQVAVPLPTPLSSLASKAACSIENFNLLCHNELCLRFSQLRQCLSLLLLLRLLLQLRLLWRQRRRVWFIKSAARTWQKTAKSRNSKSANHFRLKNCEKAISISQAGGVALLRGLNMFMTSNLLPQIQIQICAWERGELKFKLNAGKSAEDLAVLRRIIP